MGDFKVGDRVRVREDASVSAGNAGMLGSVGVVVGVHLEDYYPYRVETAGCHDVFLAREIEPAEVPAEPVSASLSACERVLWASTQEYVRAANTEAETKREGYLSAFRQVVEEDRPELAGKQWTVENGVFVVQQ